MSELVVTVFRVLGRAEHQTYDKRTGEWKSDLLIQPMMEAPDAALPSPRSSGDGSTARADTPLRLAP